MTAPTTEAPVAGGGNDIAEPYPVQFRGHALAKAALRLGGWRVDFAGLPAAQGVLVVYPHTSNWDFIVMMLAKWALGIPVRFLGKDRLFAVPLFGRWLRWLGGVPVDRTSPNGTVGQAVETLRAHRAAETYFWLGLSPEGTRKATPGWRSGFYQTALRAGVPLGLVRLDYGRREVNVRHFIRLSGDEVLDFTRIAQVYAGVRGHAPNNASPVRLLEASVPRTDTIVK